ncbi:pectin lyase-like superfamily protein [Tasmannia lanceolata]|uniref:pectin lyase-like superfamily protein n=1 Tax=Tasmannia lanceolata TaxID=3420 RepID=UPI004062CA25
MKPIKILCCVLLVLWLEGSNASNSIPQRRSLSEFHSRIDQAMRIQMAPPPSPGVKRDGRVFYPIGYGADPTGQEDSSDALLSAVEEAFGVQNGLELLPGINDLGGVVIDLQGGNYKISKPIRFPPSGGGNVLIHGGTLRASADFPTDRYLIELNSTSSSQTMHHQELSIQNEEFLQIKVAKKQYYYEDITLRDLLLDSNYRGGGVLVVDSVRTRIDTCFFIHFATKGIYVMRGHETFISNSFLGQHITAGGDPLERNFTGTAIDLYSNDNVLTDIAIFSAAYGVMIRGQANMLTGVHCYNKATYWGGVGIYVKLPTLGQTRIDNCYLDYTGIVIEDPIQVHITNAFFLGDGDITLKSMNGRISGLNIVDCMFSGSKDSIPIVKLDESNGPFTSIDQVVIDRNNVNNMKLISTVGKKTVAGKGTRWVADFSSELLFPNRISHLQYSFYMRGAARFPAHAVTNVSNNSVVVETRKVVDGVVSMVVDQNATPGEKSFLM